MPLVQILAVRRESRRILHPFCAPFGYAAIDTDEARLSLTLIY